MDALIIGCGYLGLRVAKLWLGEGRTVSALTRGRSDFLRENGIVPIVGDVLEPPPFPACDTVLYAVGLDRAAGRSMREVYVEGLSKVLRSLPENNRFLYVSSTSVYRQTDGSWVDETSLTEPLEESGRIVLEAETLLRKLRPDAVILRFAGIYGPDRLLREKAIRAGEPLSGDPEKWLNLIHVEDGAEAVRAAENASAGSLYLVGDDEPTSRRVYYTYLASMLGAPSPNFDGTSASRETHRRIRNAKIKQDLTWTPRFPSHRAPGALVPPAPSSPGS